jgi:SOS response regulatory protein OraA/RecX
MKILKMLYNNDAIILTLENGEKLSLPVKIEYSKYSTGREVDDTEIAYLKEVSEGYECRKRAFKYISASSRSETEIRRHLAKKKFSKTAVTSALEYLREHGLVNDHEFAERYACSLVNSRAAGERYLRDALAKKGVDREIISLTINTLGSQAEDPEKAYTAAEKKLLSLAGKKNLCAKVVYFLQSRGFSSKTVFSTIEKLKNAGHRFDDTPDNED